MTLPDYYFFTREDASTLFIGANSTVSGAVSVLNGSSPLHDMQSAFRPSGGAAPRSYAEFDFSGAAYASGWISFVITGNTNAPVASSTFVTFSGPTSDLFRFASNGTAGNWDVQYWDGGAWVTIGSTITTASIRTTTRSRIDIRFILDNAAGEFTIYRNGVSIASRTAADTIFTADTTLTKVRFTAIHTSTAQGIIYQALLVDSLDTRTLVIDENIATSEGGANDFSGGGEPAIDDYLSGWIGSTFETADAAGENQTYNFAAVSASYSGNTVEGVVLGIVARAQTDPGLYLRGIVRTGDVNYDGDNSVQPTSGDWDTYYLKYEVDPSTGLAWADTAAVNARSYGMNARGTP